MLAMAAMAVTNASTPHRTTSGVAAAMTDMA